MNEKIKIFGTWNIFRIYEIGLNQQKLWMNTVHIVINSKCIKGEKEYKIMYAKWMISNIILKKFVDVIWV